jgi:hypothetical protein
MLRLVMPVFAGMMSSVAMSGGLAKRFPDNSGLAPE